jgi:hypothetical protein
MKTKSKLISKTRFFLALTVLLIMISACNKRELTNNSNSQIASIIQEGKWRISYFVISKSDRTGQFSGYVFTFNLDNTVTAIQGSNGSANGTWRINKNTNSGGEYLELNFGNQFFFQELNGEWFSTRTDYARISLENLVGSSGNPDYLTFEKI